VKADGLQLEAVGLLAVLVLFLRLALVLRLAFARLLFRASAPAIRRTRVDGSSFGRLGNREREWGDKGKCEGEKYCCSTHG